MKRNYTVTMPFAGAFFVCVEATDEAEAKELAYSKIEGVTFDFTRTDGDVDSEWDTYERVNSGNVCHLSYTEVEIDDNGPVEDADTDTEGAPDAQ